MPHAHAHAHAQEVYKNTQGPSVRKSIEALVGARGYDTLQQAQDFLDDAGTTADRGGGGGKPEARGGVPRYVFDRDSAAILEAAGVPDLPPGILGSHREPGGPARQFYFGGAGTGAPFHFHDSAWNALVYGKKYWARLPPPPPLPLRRRPLRRHPLALALRPRPRAAARH